MIGIYAARASIGQKPVTLAWDGGAILGLVEIVTAVDGSEPLVSVLIDNRIHSMIENCEQMQHGWRRNRSSDGAPPACAAGKR